MGTASLLPTPDWSVLIPPFTRPEGELNPQIGNTRRVPEKKDPFVWTDFARVYFWLKEYTITLGRNMCNACRIYLIFSVDKNVRQLTDNLEMCAVQCYTITKYQLEILLVH